MRRFLASAFCLLLAPVAQAATLVGVARIPSDATDQVGDTLGGFGSGMALVPGSWHRQGAHYSGKVAMLPDRGWNTEGTTDYHGRLQNFRLTLAPYYGGAPGPEQGLTLAYSGSILLKDSVGQPLTGLDPSAVRPAKSGFPDLPVGPNRHVSFDGEGVVLPGDGTAWVSDEYGPYIYHFAAGGRMIGAIRPPDAFIPMRLTSETLHQSFSAASPPTGESYKMGEPVSGRQNNQGFEGLAINPAHTRLFAILQSAAVQDTDPDKLKATRRYTRMVEYDITPAQPKLVHEYVVALPVYDDGAVAAQSELQAIDDHRFLLLCRDSGGGFAGKRDASHFRRVELLDIAGASDIARTPRDAVNGSVAPKGVLDPSLTPAWLSDFLDINDNTQLARFGLHNGAPNDTHDLYEKWEGMALAPVGDSAAPDDYFLFTASDNDFITQHGMMLGKTYGDASGKNVDTLVLVWRVTLPKQ